MSDSETRFSAREYGAFLKLAMVSDPWPLTERNRNTFVELLNDEADARGYNDWVHAYHDLHAEVDE